MKQILIALLLFASLSATAQTAAKDSTKPRSIVPAAPSDSVTAINSKENFDLAVNAAAGKAGYAMTYTKDSVLKVYDSAQTITVLVRAVKEYQNQIASVNNQLQVIGIEAELARDIFRYINTDGSVSDKEKFKAAVDKYVRVLPK